MKKLLSNHYVVVPVAFFVLILLSLVFLSGKIVTFDCDGNNITFCIQKVDEDVDKDICFIKKNDRVFNAMPEDLKSNVEMNVKKQRKTSGDEDKKTLIMFLSCFLAFILVVIVLLVVFT